MTCTSAAVAASRRQARSGAACAGGNALSYRPDSIPGYTGYVPGSQCVPPAVHTRVSQRDPDAPLAGPRRIVEASGGTTYATAFQIDPLHDYSTDPRVRCSAAATTASNPCAAAQAARFEGLTTYQAEVLQHDSSAINQGYRDGIDWSRSGSAAWVGGSAFQPASPAPPQSRGFAAVPPGYLTTAAASQLPLAKQHAARSVLQAAGSSPDVPSRGAAASGWPSRGHRPKHNVALQLPPPSSETTWGAASQQAQRRPLPPPDGKHAIKSNTGLLGPDFFDAGAAADFVSENGLAEAARYHTTSRPFEGRMRIPQPSRTAPRGCRFTG
ncbi:hypothetical protein D9Q98_004855 [Chlorella vulgaris]|uniref:Uncharacterized protein n=1 Tax=Chlorella vulgaris TaxID=3077 RepID=A0A9D4YX26_CHLVU|nr:hypothetical protein D9Q98_004855 [Chlorella vulgaris]